MKKKKGFNRFTALVLIMILLFSALIARLSYLQIVNAEEYKELANNKSIRQIPEPAPRGEIMDRNNILLATNKQSYMIVFMETDESRKYFFDTFRKVFDLLDNSVRLNEKGEKEREKLQDEFDLKVNPFRFEFKSSDPEARRIFELRFKKDRGFDDKVKRKIFKNKKGELTDEEKEMIDEELLTITPEEVFYDLIVQYDLYKLLNFTAEEEKMLLKNKSAKEIAEMLLEKYPIEEIRRYMLVKDAVKMQSFSGYKPVVIASNIDKSTAIVFEQVKNDLPGIDVSMQPIRYYPFGSIGSSFLGYISKISADNKERYEERGYDISTDYIGVAGLESAFEDRLRGSKGGTTVKVNKQGRKTEELFRLDPSQGQNMVLTLDSNLQAVAERALGEIMTDLQINNTHGTDPVNTANATRGAAVVMDVNTGAILAMASNPGFDPNLFTVPGRLTPELYKQYFAPDLVSFGENYIKNMKLDKNKVPVDMLFPIDTNIKDGKVRRDFYDIYPKPFYNYATSSLIPPGSTFKALTGIAGLEEGVISPTTKIVDAGVFDDHGADTNNYTGACWIWNEHKGSHGAIDVKTALEVSCNYFFYEIGYRLFKLGGRDKLADYAWRFGLGVDPKSNAKPSTGIEIYENFGQVYNNESRKNRGAVEALDGIDRLMKAGIYYAGSGVKVIYPPINISNTDEDSEKVREAKDAIKKTIRDNIKSENTYSNLSLEYLRLKQEMITLMGNLIEALPEDKRNSYKKEDDSKSMAEAISTYVTFDVKSAISTAGNVYDASIGQGINQFTPLQLTNYMATLINGGNRYKVRLVDKFVDAKGNKIEEFKPEIIEKIDLKPYNIATIKEGLHKVTSETGTASYAFKDFPIDTGGKTGSATFAAGGIQELIGRTSYGVYLGFAPYDKPEIAVCVVIFDGGHGGYVAPVARAIYETYFREKLKTEYPAFKPMFNYTLNP